MKTKSKCLKPLSYLVFTLSIFFLISCGGSVGSTKPTITSFEVNKGSIQAGEVITIKWDTANTGRAGVTCDLWKDYVGNGNRQRISTKCKGTYSDRPVHEVYYTLSVSNVVSKDNSEIQTITQDKVVNVNNCQGGRSVCVFASNLPERKEYAFGELVYFDLDYRNDSNESISILAVPHQDNIDPDEGITRGPGIYSSDFGLLKNRFITMNSTSSKNYINKLRLTAQEESNRDQDIYEYFQDVDFVFKTCKTITTAICIENSNIPKTPNSFNFSKQIDVKVDYQNPEGKEIFIGISALGKNLSEVIYPERIKQTQKNGSVTLSMTLKPSSESILMNEIWIYIYDRDGDFSQPISMKFHPVNYTFDSAIQ